LSFAAIGRQLGITRQAAWRLLTRCPTAGVRCSTCQALVTTRNFQVRTVGEVWCRGCLGTRPDAPFALRLRSYRLAAGLTRTELEAAAGLGTARIQKFEDGAAKPQAATRAKLAKVLRAPDLERFGDEGG
jgi:hypothetical protein